MSSPTKKAEVIIHPVRMRIIQCLVQGERMTAQQLQERLQDVPQATLYRHLKRLVDADVIVVAEELPNRGTLEKVYVLPELNAEISPEEIMRASAEDHMTYFMNFASHLIGQYGRYIEQPGRNLFKDGVTYRQFPLNLTDEENMAMLMAIKDLIVEYSQKGSSELENKQSNESGDVASTVGLAKDRPQAQRRRRVLTIVDFPDV